MQKYRLLKISSSKPKRQWLQKFKTSKLIFREKQKDRVTQFCGVNIVDDVSAFNIDVDHPITMLGELGSYFGYSTAFLNASNQLWAIVGAPRSNFSDIYQPGQIFKCPLHDLKHKTVNCTTLILDHANDTSGSWLGVSVDATLYDNGHVLACAHRWMSSHEKIRGVCYSIDGNFNNESLVNLTSFHYLDATTLGISSQFIKNSCDIITGAPAPYSVGSLYKFQVSRKAHYEYVTTSKMAYKSPKSDLTSYYGFSVTSGYFMDNGEVQFVIGAPKQETNKISKDFYKGKVFMLNPDNNDIYTGDNLIGEQMGEYYGASVCAVDLNNDQLDDLLVGAPLYSAFDYGDEGRVYVYINLGSCRLQKANTLMGSSVPKSRFGSSITDIGDINKDGYDDIAIGAPYENDNGAVYIYHGNAHGISGMYKQRITPANPKIRGFGICIASRLDIDANNYNDILIGAYQSDQVQLFRSRPTVKLYGKLTLNVTKIDTEQKKCVINGEKFSCFELEACLTYSGNSLPNSLNIKTLLELDIMQSNSRVMVIDKNMKLQHYVEATITIYKISNKNCFNYTVIVKEHKSTTNYLELIHVQFSYDIDSRSKSFCSTCPIVDPSDINYATTTVGFKINCGTNKICETDLRINASFKQFPKGSTLIINSIDHLDLHIDIYNSAEAAYNTILRMTLPSWMKVDTNQFHFESKKNSTHIFLNCFLANPLHRNNSVRHVI
ncbi:hypothetical protein CHUAL_006712 [Chamberlinius hualienensis]